MDRNYQPNQNKEVNHLRVWFIAAINLIPTFGGAVASLVDSYTEKKGDNSEQLKAILDEIQSLKSNHKNVYHQQEELPLFKKDTSISAGKGLFGGNREIWHTDLSIDGKYIVVVHYGRTGGKIYDAKTGQILQSIGGFPNGLYVHRPKVLFNPNVRGIPVIAVEGYDKNAAVIDIYWKYDSHKFKKKKTLYLSDDGDLDHLNCDGWSPDGKYFVSGSYSRRLDGSSNIEGRYKMIIWDVFSDDERFYVPAEGSLESGDIFWHKNSRYLLVVISGTVCIDIQTKRHFSLKEIDSNLSYLYSSEFHPEKPYLAVTDGYDFYVIDVSDKKIITKFNDAKEEKVKVARKYRYKDHSSYVHEFHYYTSHLAFSPNGKYLATSDYFGNIVIRSCDDFSILHSINMSNHARTSSNTMRLRFLPSDEAGLIIETCDEETEKKGFWFMDARYPMEPVRVAEGMRFGDLQWCEVGVLLSQYKHAVEIYSYQ